MREALQGWIGIDGEADVEACNEVFRHGDSAAANGIDVSTSLSHSVHNRVESSSLLAAKNSAEVSEKHENGGTFLPE